MSKKAKNYTEAMERLDEILEQIDESKIPIDVLAESVVEAADLLKQCKKMLTETEAKVKNVLEDLENEFGEAGAEDTEEEDD